MSFTVSQEQADIIHAIADGANIIVEAVAGSGKTTLVLEAAKAIDRKFMQITYNAALKGEVRKKALLQGIQNLEVHSYHSLAVKYYYKDAYTDINMQKIITHNLPRRSSAVHILVVDEAQDMTFLYYQLIKKFIFDCNIQQVVIMGDRQQSIYEFKGADYRYLTLARHIILQDCIDWRTMTLNMSFRLTDQVGKFMSELMNRTINTCRVGPKITYLHKSDDRIVEWLHTFILTLIADGNRPQDIFILAPSMKTEACFKELEHRLVRSKILCYSPDIENKMDDRVAEDKLVITTLHASKGRERKCVILFNYDDTYFDYYERKADILLCPNIHYVAATRASEKLILIQGGGGVIQYMDPALMEDMEIESDSLLQYSKHSRSTTTFHKIGVTDLTKFIKHHYIMELDRVCHVQRHPSLGAEISLPTIAGFDSSFEEVSAILGIAIPAMWEYYKSGECSILKTINKKDNLIRIREISNESESGVNVMQGEFVLEGDFHDVIRYSIYYKFITSNFAFKIAQMKRFDWADNEYEHCVKMLDNAVPYDHGAVFEKPVIIKIKWRDSTIEISGRVDYMLNDEVWEFKCVDELCLEHLLQLIIYAFMIENCTDTPQTIKFAKLVQRPVAHKYKLLNCRNGMIWELDYNAIDIKQIMDLIFENYFITPTVTDDDFIAKCLGYQPSVSASASATSASASASASATSVGATSIQMPSVYSMTVDQLKQYCRDNGISGYSKLKKAELLALVLDKK